MELIEKIPIERLELLNHLDLNTYIHLADLKKYKKEEVKQHFKLIKGYVSNMLKCKGDMKKVYKHSEKSQKGRLYGSNSIQALDGIIRGFLFNGISTDIDMVNCHPVLLKYICKENNIRCPILTEYVDNRDKIIET